jgi:Holliday junction resolvasome RuvABC endonuclease subunit
LSQHVFNTYIPLGNTHPKYLGAIYRQLEQIIQQYQPQQIAIGNFS